MVALCFPVCSCRVGDCHCMLALPCKEEKLGVIALLILYVTATR